MNLTDLIGLNILEEEVSAWQILLSGESSDWKTLDLGDKIAMDITTRQSPLVGFRWVRVLSLGYWKCPRPDDAIFDFSPFLCVLWGYVVLIDGDYTRLARCDGDSRTLHMQSINKYWSQQNPSMFPGAWIWWYSWQWEWMHCTISASLTEIWRLLTSSLN